MTSRFRLNSVSIKTIDGEVDYDFASPITVLAGKVGVGKSTLFELFKFGLGGDGLLADVIINNVLSVTLNVSVGSDRYSLSRSISASEAKTVQVVDLVSGNRLPDHNTDAKEPTLNSLLLGALGIPSDMKAASRAAKSSRAGSRISFMDLFKFMYVSQANINQDIADSDDSYYAPKRRAVFELLFGLTNPNVLRLHSLIAQTQNEELVAQGEYEVVVRFLADSRTSSRIDTEEAQRDAQEKLESAIEILEEIKRPGTPVMDEETQVLLDLLGETERDLANSKTLLSELKQRSHDLENERRIVNSDLERLRRIRSANFRMADIEFAVCPRCMQSLRERDFDHIHCRLCLQPEPSNIEVGDLQSVSYEQTQLQEQLTEMALQISGLSIQMAEMLVAIEKRDDLARILTGSIDERTRERVVPQMQAFADASALKAETNTRIVDLEKTMRQWDRVDDLSAKAEDLHRKIESFKNDLRTLDEPLAERRREILDELDREFSETVEKIGIPGVRSASLHSESYLPLLNGKIFSAFSPAGGGIRTATQVAYWISLMTVALRHGDTVYPSFLLIDGPQTSLNEALDLTSALYSRLATMVDASNGKLQVIIGDNELPLEYRRHFIQIPFDYDHPTIRTIKHPGPSAVRTISDLAMEKKASLKQE